MINSKLSSIRSTENPKTSQNRGEAGPQVRVFYKTDHLSCDVMKSWDKYLIVSVERSVLLHVLRTSVDPDDPDVVGLRSQAVHDEEAASGPRSRNRKLIGGESGRHHGGILCNN